MAGQARQRPTSPSRRGWGSRVASIGAWLAVSALAGCHDGAPPGLDLRDSRIQVTPSIGLVADGAQSATVQVKVLDLHGDPVQGIGVALVASGSGNTLMQPAAKTDAHGIATGSLASTVAETKVLQAILQPSSSALLLKSSASAQFVADAANLSAALSSATAAPFAAVIADGVEVSTVTVTVRDAHGNPVPGQTVELAVDGSSNVLVQPAAATDAAGVATGTLATTVAEIKTVTATINPGPGQVVVLDQPAIEFLGDPNDLSGFLSGASASPALDVVADGTDSATITVVARDGNGNVVPGVTVAIAASGSANSIGQPAGPTDATGTATATLATTAAESKTVTAILDPGPSQVTVSTHPTVDFIGDARNIDAALSALSASPSLGLVADDVETSTLTAVVRDVHGNAVPGVDVVFSASGTGNSLAQPAGPTDATGAAAATLASTTAELKTASALANPGAFQVALGDAPTIEFVADASNLSATLSDASASPAAGVIANGVAASTITVTVRDAHGNPVPGRTVELQSDGSNDTLAQPAAVTDAAGVSTGALASLTAELKTLTVVVDPGPSQVVLATQPTVGFVGDPANLDAALSSVVASPAVGVVADGSAVSTITVTVRDAHGNPVAGRTVALAASGAGNTLAQPAAATDASGVATGTLATTTAEPKTITATVDPGPGELVLADQPTIAFIGDAANVDAALSSVVAAPSAGLVADGAETSTITVTVLDANANPVPGVVVVLAATGSGNALVQPGATSDANGEASGTLATTTAEIKTVGATVAPGPGQTVLADTPTVEFDPVPVVDALASSVGAAPATGTLADGASPVTITVTVLDQLGAPMAGKTVQLAATGKGNTLVQPGSPTAADGTATGTLASSRAERKTITAVVDPGGSAVALAGSATADFVAVVTGRRYVRKTGSDLNGGTGPNDAWQTIGKAASSVAAGDTVLVGAGSYPEAVLMTTDGTAADRIVFRADSLGEHTGDAGEVVIDAGGAAYGFAIDGASYVTLQGFTLRNAAAQTGAGVQVGDTATDGVHVLDNTMYDNGKGIQARNASNLVVQGNRISRNRRAPSPAPGGGEGIVLDDSDSASVANNLVYANDGQGLWVTSGSSGAWIEGNTLYANQDDQLQVDGLLNDATARNNVLSEGATNGLSLSLGSLLSTSYNISWGHVGLDWLGLLLGSGDANVDPLHVDPLGPDGLLGGADGADDSFALDDLLASPGFDTGSAAASAVTLPDGSTFADRTSRTDGVLDGSGADGATLNKGFHYEAPLDDLAPLAAGDVRVALGRTSERQPRLATWDDGAGAWTSGLRAPPSGATLRWLAHARSPLANDEELVLSSWTSATATGLELARWSGIAWHEDWTAGGGATSDADKRGFDLAYEDSGDALAVWSDGTANPRFRAWTSGAWSSEAAVFASAPGSGAVRWIELAARPGTDEVTLVWADSASDLFAVVWNGASWDAANVATLETALRTTATRPFDVEHETASGDALVLWAGPSDTAYWSARAAGSSTWTAAATITGLGFTTALYDLAADPASDRIAMAGLEDAAAGTEPKVAMWTGASWTNVARLETGTNVTLGALAGDLGVAAGWVGDSGVAVALYADTAAGAIDWGRWTAAGGWALQGDVAVAGKGTSQSLELAPDVANGRVLAAISDSNGDLYVAHYDGASWTITNGGAALETSLASTASAPFALSVGD